MTWKEEVQKIVQKGCTDSDIEDFVEAHPEINGKDIWDFLYELDAPDGCKGCEYIQLREFMPCIKCIRRTMDFKDYFKAREK